MLVFLTSSGHGSRLNLNAQDIVSICAYHVLRSTSRFTTTQPEHIAEFVNFFNNMPLNKSNYGAIFFSPIGHPGFYGIQLTNGHNIFILLHGNYLLFDYYRYYLRNNYDRSQNQYLYEMITRFANEAP